MQGENNNVGRSDTIEVILTPPPDLVVTEMNIPDTMHNNEDVYMNYVIENQGGSTITIHNGKTRFHFQHRPYTIRTSC